MINLEKNKLNAVYEIFDKIHLNKIVDSEIRKKVLKFIIAISKELDSMRNDIEQMKIKYFSGFNDEEKQEFQLALSEVASFIRNNALESARAKDIETSEKYPELTKAYLSLNTDLVELQKETVSLNVEKFDLDSFLDAMVGQPINISMKELDILNPIFNNDSES